MFMLLEVEARLFSGADQVKVVIKRFLWNAGEVSRIFWCESFPLILAFFGDALELTPIVDLD